jgi:predicted branched-subunit amino acid permease/branched-subunit amino acid transport protein
MFFLRSIRRHPEFRIGARDMLPLAAGIGAWGLMTGVAMVKSGMSVIEALAMTFFVYAGSSQLASIPLIVAGAPVWVILATGFCVNLRFVVFSLHLRPYLMHLPRWRRLVNGYLTADLSYAMFTRRFPQPATQPAEHLAQEAYLAGNYFVTWCSWIGLSVLGVVLANFIPGEHADAHSVGGAGWYDCRRVVFAAAEAEHRGGDRRGGCDLFRARAKAAPRRVAVNGATDTWTLLAIAGLSVVTVLARCFFFILDRPWPMPAWAQRALQYAPVAALSAVVVPEVVTLNGHFVGSWQDARIFAALAGVAVYLWRRSVLLTLMVGMLAYLPLHLVLGW